MLGLNDMLADMLKKAIPPEVMALLTEEKVKEIGEKANAFITDIRESLDFIKQQNSTTHDLLNAQIKLLEEMKNDNGSNSNRDANSGRRGNRAKSDSSGGS